MPKQPDAIELMLDQIDEQLETINTSAIMRKAEKLIEQRNKLMSARRALLGAGNKMTGGGGARVTQAQIVAKLSEDEDKEWGTDELASALGTTDSVVRSHLNRGADERFTKLNNGKWVLRDPENDDDDEDNPNSEDGE